MAPSGWFKLYREIFDHPVLSGDQASRIHAFADLVGMAAFEDGQRRIGSTVVDLKRGELVASVRFLSTRWGWGRGKVQRYMARLEAERMVIATRSQTDTPNETPAGTVYRVVNYDAYQEQRDGERDSKQDRDGTGAGQGRDKGKKLRSKEGKDRTGAHALPDGWEPNDAHRELATERGVSVADEESAFRDWVADKGVTSKDWNARFRNWLRRATPKPGLRVVRGGKPESEVDEKPWWIAEEEKFGPLRTGTDQ